MTDELLYDQRDGIGHLTFNRPQARNALTFPMYERLAEIATDPGDVRALVITGAGDRAFAAGTDINQFRAFSTAADAMAYEQKIDRVLGAVERCRVPTIAAIAGACTGGGAAIAAACDLRLAAANARFGFPIARTLGNCLSMSNLARLSALIGPARVIEMIFTARLFTATQALAAGLLTEDNPSPAGLAYVIPGYGDADWLDWCRAMAAAFEDAFRRTPLEFDVGRLAMTYEANDDMRGAIDDFFDGLIRRHVMIAYNGLRGATRAASSPGPAASRDGSRYALEVLRRARAHGDATGLELYAPSTDPAMQDRAAMIDVVRRLRPSRIVAFSTEAAMVHHRRGGAASSDADSMRWIAAQPAAEATQAASVDFLEDLARD